MAKRSLTDLLAGDDLDAPDETPAPAPQVTVRPPTSPPSTRKKATSPRSRAAAEPEAAVEAIAPIDIVPVNIFVASEDRRRLKQLSLDTGISLQRLGHTAWNMLLESRGLPPLQPASANVPSGRARAGRG